MHGCAMPTRCLPHICVFALQSIRGLLNWLRLRYNNTPMIMTENSVDMPGEFAVRICTVRHWCTPEGAMAVYG